jgi:hypothetical protein
MALPVLNFHTIEEVLPAIQRLATGHATRGNWTLAQICRHLADTFAGSIDGFGMTLHRHKRRWLSKPLLWLTYRVGIPRGFTADPGLTPPGDCELAESIDRLEQAIERYRLHRGALTPHPLFGRLSRRQWDRMHCFHCAHHLSFVVHCDTSSEADS